MAAIGAMTMPPSFEYKKVFLRGRPIHEKYDSFWCKHPPMDPGRWAKIFAPFDALEGFDEAVRAKEELYCERHELGDTKKEELNQKLTVLHSLTRNSREARKNAPIVTIRFFSPCVDRHSEWYGRGGQYRTITDGVCRRVDISSIFVDNEIILLENISEITFKEHGVHSSCRYKMEEESST